MVDGLMVESRPSAKCFDRAREIVNGRWDDGRVSTNLARCLGRPKEMGDGQ
jgi:hypothetical protein